MLISLVSSIFSKTAGFWAANPLRRRSFRVCRSHGAAIARICRWIVANPAEETSVTSWSKVVGASERTIIRLFPEETGMTFTRWRQQARLLAAVQMLANDRPVTEIATELGYDSPSAFSAMFRKALGSSPTEYFRRTDAD